MATKAKQTTTPATAEDKYSAKVAEPAAPARKGPVNTGYKPEGHKEPVNTGYQG